MNERDRHDDPADDGWVEVERSVHPVDPDSELGRAMAKARAAGIMAPGEFDEGSIRPTLVGEETMDEQERMLRDAKPGDVRTFESDIDTAPPPGQRWEVIRIEPVENDPAKVNVYYRIL